MALRASDALRHFSGGVLGIPVMDLFTDIQYIQCIKGLRSNCWVIQRNKKLLSPITIRDCLECPVWGGGGAERQL